MIYHTKKIWMLWIFIALNMAVQAQSSVDIFDACRQGKLAIVKAAYAQNPAILDSSNYRGHTPLILAVYNNQPTIVKFLLAHKVNAKIQDKSGNTALMGAVFRGYLPYVEQLITAGAPVDQKNYNGATALTFAATFGRVKIAKVLLKNGANPLLPDARSQSPIDYAKNQNNAPMIALLSKFVPKED